MMLHELFLRLETDVPIFIIEGSPSESPDEIQHTEVLYDSEDNNTYVRNYLKLEKLILDDYIIHHISLIDDCNPMQLKIYVSLA